MTRARLMNTAAALVAAAFLTACDTDSHGSPGPASEILPFADELSTERTPALAGTGEATQFKSLHDGERMLLARTLIGETRPGASEAEMRAIIGVILNRWESGRYGEALADVLLHENGGTWAFSCFDPRYSHATLWAPGVEKSRRFTRLLGVVDRAWQVWRVGERHSYLHYWHPSGMKPKGARPWWARGKKATRVGTAMFLRG